MVSQLQASSSKGSTPTIALEAPKQINAVKWWAGAGIAVIALQAYIYGAWIMSGPSRTPDGPTPVPDWMRYTVRLWEGLSIIIGIAVLYRVIVRPWRRERRLTLDGMLLIAFASMYWQDPLAAYSGYWVTYSTPAVQVGSWLGAVPGHLGQNAGAFVEPLLFAFPAYFWACVFATIGNNALMRRLQRRKPTVGRFGMFTTAFAGGFVMTLVVEGVWVFMGMYHFNGAIRWLTLFHGRYYQLPLNEIFFFSICLGGWAVLRYYTDDKGRTMVERGSDRLKTAGANRTGVRLLAIVGVVNAIYFVGYMVPTQWFAAHADNWPQDIISRSYMTDGLCGPGTNYACPGPGVPNPRPDAVYPSPDGGLYDPTGTEGPGQRP